MRPDARLTCRIRELLVEKPMSAEKLPFVVKSEAARNVLSQLAQAWSARRQNRFVPISWSAATAMPPERHGCWARWDGAARAIQAGPSGR